MKSFSEELGITLNLIATEPESCFPPLRARFCSSATVGDRNDFVWAQLDTPLRVGISDEVARNVLVASRHLGFDVRNISQLPMDVYVCTVMKPEMVGAAELNASDVSITCWAILLDGNDDRTDLKVIYSSLELARGNVFHVNPVHQ